MFKKIAAFLLTAVMVITVFSTSVLAEKITTVVTTPDGKTDFIVTDENGNIIEGEAYTYYSKKGTFGYELIDGGIRIYNLDNKKMSKVVIPSKIEGYPVTIIGENAFCDSKKIKEIKIPDSVKIIEQYAFNLCPKLEKVVLGKNVEVLGDWAFADCKKIKSVKLNKKLKSIGEYCFLRNYSLTKITIPDKVEKIGSYAFERCKKLKTVTIGKGVKKIGDVIFSGCYGIKTVNYNAVNCKETGTILRALNVNTLNLGDYVERIPSGMMFETSVAKMKCGSSLKKIEKHAITTSQIGSMELPRSLKKVGYQSFIWSSVGTVYYGGSDADWKKIKFGSDTYSLKNANRYNNYFSLKKASISGVKTKKYKKGKPVILDIKVKYSGKTLKKNLDYKVTYKNNKKVGTAKVTIKGLGKYSGKVTKTFKIKK